MTRPRALVIAAAMALCLVAGSRPRAVGDGGEYIAMALNLASWHRPAVATADLFWIQEAVAGIDASLDGWDIRDSTISGPDGRRDFIHFWVYPLLAVPAVWITQLIHVTPIAAFAAVNLCLLALAFWLALPRIGGAATLLLFGSPIIWWIDKPHTEAFTFSLLAIAMLVMQERPWWSMLAAGLAAAQNPPIGVVVVLVAAACAATRPEWLRERRFLFCLAAGLGLAALQPGYTYLRHGTPTLLLRANPNHVPSLAELIAVPIDPSVGLLPNFPMLLVAAAGATVVVMRRHPRELLALDPVIAKLAGAAFLFSFAQATNIHHGGTPGMSRYGVWLIPLAIPVFARARALGSSGWRAFIRGTATVSAAICVFAFHPGVPQYSRERTILANFLWTKHPAWNNPLPEVFAEIQGGREDRWVPIATANCEKVLLTGRGDGAAFPVPCFPAQLPVECATRGALCYANLVGMRYQFARAPGSAVQLEGFTYQPVMAWPPEAESHVRDLLSQSQWWTLKPKAGGGSMLRQFTSVRVMELEGPRRFVFILRDTRPDARLLFRPRSKLTGVLSDGMTGETLTTVQFDGQPLEQWALYLPPNAPLLILSLWPS